MKSVNGWLKIAYVLPLTPESGCENEMCRGASRVGNVEVDADEVVDEGVESDEDVDVGKDWRGVHSREIRAEADTFQDGDERGER